MSKELIFTITFPTVDVLSTTEVKPMVPTQEELTTFYKRLSEGKSAELLGMVATPVTSHNT